MILTHDSSIRIVQLCDGATWICILGILDFDLFLSYKCARQCSPVLLGGGSKWQLHQPRSQEHNLLQRAVLLSSAGQWSKCTSNSACFWLMLNLSDTVPSKLRSLYTYRTPEGRPKGLKEIKKLLFSQSFIEEDNSSCKCCSKQGSKQPKCGSDIFQK